MLQKIDEQNEQQIIVRAKPKLKRGELAKIVFQGHFFRVWQWPQKLFDNSEATFESLSRADTVTVLALTKDQKIIMTRQSQPGFDEFWSMPGGIMDEGESVLSSSKRELLEETGYASNEWYFLFSGQMNSRIDWANFYLIAKNCEQVSEKNLDPGEKISLEFFDLNQFAELVKDKNFRDSDFALWYLRNNGEELKPFLD
jgi:ADP-ribose pyrophosphatase